MTYGVYFVVFDNRIIDFVLAATISGDGRSHSAPWQLELHSKQQGWMGAIQTPEAQGLVDIYIIT